jgi:hypothetical protein
MRIIIAATALAIGACAGEAADADPVGPRIRSSHPYIRAMIEEAARRSATFRRLVTDIEETDGIVYVEQGACGHRVHACLALSVTPAADYRILRVLVDARQPDWNVMASIGHELQHALEVLANTRVTTAEGIFLFYQRESATMGETFETAAAERIGMAIEKDVNSFSKRSQ